MILIFDLDDTLYDEMSFVKSGFNTVAQYGEEVFGWDAESSTYLMYDILRKEGRGKVFDHWLGSHGRCSKTHVAKCIQIYRHHIPNISIFPEAMHIFHQYRGKIPFYLVTDGHKIVQKNKLHALGILPEFRRTFITHQFGIQHAKPSTYCFELIKRSEKCEWFDMVYIGDNPAKDFVNLNPLGMLTIRVNTGSHKNTIAQCGYDAQIHIPNLGALPKALSAMPSCQLTG
jgi:putative hydrolase of the HAD superfamily